LDKYISTIAGRKHKHSRTRDQAQE